MAKYTHPADFVDTFWTVFDGDFYVSTLGSDVIGDGSPQNPFLTINKAFEFATDGEKVIIGPDEYVEQETEVVSPGSFGAEPPCRVATTGDINLSIGGVITIDGVIAQPGDRVLVWNQVSPVENGIYVIQSGPWQRADNFDSNDNIIRGKLVPVMEGSTYASAIFQNVSATDIILGTTPITFSRVSTSSGGGETGDPGDIDAAINALKDGVPVAGDTLNKLYQLTQGLSGLSTEDINTIAKLNAIVTDANLITNEYFDSIIGDFDQINTIEDNLVESINSIFDDLTTNFFTQMITGLTANLQTTNKSNLVAAINELKVAIDTGGGGGGSFALTDGSGTTANGTAVNLGGALSTNALIDFNGQMLRIFYDNVETGWLTNLQINDSSILISCTGNNGTSILHINANYASLSFSISGGGTSGIYLSPTGMLVDDRIANKGLTYEADYSSNFTDRSLVDKAYVDAAIGASGGGGGGGSFNLGNGSGTTANANGVDLGGQLSSNAEINASGQSFKVINNDIPAGRQANLQVDEASIILSTSSNDLTPSLHIGSGFASLSFNDEMGAVSDIRLGAGGMEVIDNVNNRGLIYDGDYSSNYQDRSLVDKAYVDTAVAGAGGGGGTVSMPIFQVGKKTQQEFAALTDITGWEAQQMFNDTSNAYSWNTATGELSIQQDGIYEIMFEASCLASFGNSRTTAQTSIWLDGSVLDDSERLAYLRIKDHGASTSASHIVSRSGSNVTVKTTAQIMVGSSTCVVDRAKLIVKRIG